MDFTVGFDGLTVGLFNGLTVGLFNGWSTIGTISGNSSWFTSVTEITVGKTT